MALVQANYPTTSVSPGGTIMETTVRMTTTTANGGSRLAQMQARFQQKQLQEKEQKLLRLYESQQQRAFQRVAARGSAGSSSVSSVSSNTSNMSVGKVRQMFDERRTNGNTGWDRSYPLEPLEGSINKPRGAQPVPKTKANRVASLDRSQNNNQQFTKTNIKRSKSHARVGANNDVNGSYGRQHSNIEADYNTSFRRLTVDDENGSYRKVNNTERFTESFRIQPEDDFNDGYGRQPVNIDNFDGSYRKPPANPIEDFNGSYRKEPLINSEDFNGSFRRQESNNIQSNPREHIIEVKYEDHGDDQQLNENQTFTVIDDKRREDLFAKYQVRDIENNELLSASPPPELYNDDEVDDSFVFKKLPNVGGPLILEESPVTKGSDKFKTYNASKHKREESKKMPPPSTEVKKGGVARRESVSPPPKAISKPALRKTEGKATSPPGGVRRPTASTASKQVSSPQPKPASSSSNTMQKVSSKRTAPALSQRNSPTSTSSQKQAASTGRMAPRPGAASAGRDDLVDCRHCQRRFASDRVEKHETICERTSRKKRKEYDATKHRVQGTEAEVYVKRATKKGAQQQKVSSKKDDWRKKHEDFIATIRAAKEAQAHIKAGGNIRDLPPPPPMDTSDYIQCPHCSRKFNEAAAERHIPRCATMLHNKPKPGAAGPSRGTVRKR